jgi:cell division protein FtsB
MAESGRRQAQAQHQDRLSSVQIMFGAILAVGLLLAINFSARIAAGQPLQDAYDRVTREIEALRAEQAALITQRDFVQSDAYVERWARDEGKMIREGEVLVVPVPAGVASADAPAETVSVPIQTTDPDPEPWQLWWSLFFDNPPPVFGE